MTQVVTPAAYATGYTSVTTKFDTGREQFTAFYPCAAFASDCILTAHLYYAWGMHGILPGARDALFSVQVRFPLLPSYTFARALQVLCTGGCLCIVWQVHSPQQHQMLQLLVLVDAMTGSTVLWLAAH